MIYVVQADLRFRNTARRDVAKANSEAYAASKSTVRVEHQPLPVTAKRPNPPLTVALAFVNKADADAYWANADTHFGTGTNGPQTGSKLWRHDCRDDEGVGPCVDEATRAW